MLKEVVYLGRSQPNTIQVANKSTGEAFLFDAVTRCLVTFRGSSIEADTDIDSGLIDYSIGGGAIEFSFNGLAIEPGEYFASLIVFDPAHSSGQALAHAEERTLQFVFFGED